MKSVFVEDKTLDSVWFRLLSEVYDKGRTNRIDSGSFAGSSRLEFDLACGTIQYPTARPLAPIMPEGVSPVTTDTDIENYFVNYLMDGRNLQDNEHYRYATWITGGAYRIPQFKLPNDEEREDMWVIVPNQLKWCIEHYKQKGFGNNHCTIQVGYPESNMSYDQPYENEFERGTSPCLRLIDTKLVEEKGRWVLNFHVHFRSQDLYSAWSINMGGIVILMEFMASELEVEVGMLSFSCIKLHCYSHQLEVLKARLGKGK